ncbi:CPBP family intramembrane glutamic endopeptidase [Paenibacillus dakarensis]|uniref:CPBP family intramembrane glutamic endopeptidase n=1 Tax=Paenibacillus dakarensis TaxID=1527293 RepID=UPI0006D57B12|nr:type II CAAX endopeptidase family protein [Paenibacillus dakarensis]
MKSVNRYSILTFVVTYTLWGIVAIYTQWKNVPFGSSIPLIVLYVLGVLSPAISAMTINKQLVSKEAFHSFCRNCFMPPKKFTWYVLILVVTVVFQLLPYVLFGGERSGPLYLIVLQFPLYILIGGMEEIGWRGLMQPELEKKWSPFISTMIVGVVWSLWHLPLFFIVGTYQELYLSFFNFSISTIAFSFILAVVYQRTRSVFMCIITHAFLNSLSAVFITGEAWMGELISLLIGFVIFIWSQITDRSRPNCRGIRTWSL